MRKKIKRLISLILVLTMIFTTTTLNDVYAGDGGDIITSPNDSRGSLDISAKGLGTLREIDKNIVPPKNIDEADVLGFDVVTFTDGGANPQKPFKRKESYVVDVKTSATPHTPVKPTPAPVPEPVYTKSDNKVGDDTAPVNISTTTSSSNYHSNIQRIFVTEATFNKNLKSYISNIALFFSEKGVLPPSKAIVNDLKNDKGVRISDEYAIDYEEELKKLEESELLSSDTTLIDIRDMIALYLYNSSTYTDIGDKGVIDKQDVEQYKTSSSEVYKFPTNIPVYENGKFIASYNLAKDSHIVDGRNKVIDN